MATAQQEKNALGHDKVARYGWTVSGKPGRFEWLPKHVLKVDRATYQREGINSKILELSSNWSWIACGTLTVAERDGVFWVADGQHRKLAADRRSDIASLPCMIFQTESVCEDAQAFLDTNTNRRPVTALDKFRARLATGDQVAHYVDGVIKDSGLRLATASAERGDFKAVALALSIAERDADALKVVLGLGGEMANAEGVALHKRVVMGLYYIHRHFDLRTPRLLARIKTVGITGLARGADKAAAYHGKGGERVVAEGMLQAINHGLRQRFEMPGAE